MQLNVNLRLLKTAENRRWLTWIICILCDCPTRPILMYVYIHVVVLKSSTCQFACFFHNGHELEHRNCVWHEDVQKWSNTLHLYPGQWLSEYLPETLVRYKIENDFLFLCYFVQISCLRLSNDPSLNEENATFSLAEKNCLDFTTPINQGSASQLANTTGSTSTESISSSERFNG